MLVVLTRPYMDHAFTDLLPGINEKFPIGYGSPADNKDMTNRNDFQQQEIGNETIRKEGSPHLRMSKGCVRDLYRMSMRIGMGRPDAGSFQILNRGVKWRKPIITFSYEI